jgi:hypothetical protein
MRYRSFEKRLLRLEKQHRNDPVVVQRPDGTIRELRRPKGYALQILGAVLNPFRLTPTLLADLELMTSSTLTGPEAGLFELALALYDPQ